MKALIAVDRSRVSNAIIKMAKDLLQADAAAVLLVNVAPREADILGHQIKRKVITTPVPSELLDRRKLLDAHAHTLEAAGILTETLLIRGDPGPTLIAEANRWGAQLIMMGSHGHGAIYRKLVGSVSESVLRNRRFPVLIVPAERSQR